VTNDPQKTIAFSIQAGYNIITIPIFGRRFCMASVTYEHVTKKFGDFTALNDLNIEIADKEFLVLVGPSGCGKTTALRCLAGLEEVSGGRVLIANQVVNDVAPKDRDIAMVFQSYALYPHMTVFDNMAFGLKLRKVPKDQIKRRVEESAQILGIEHLLSANHVNFPAVKGSVLLLVVRSFANQRSSFLTSLFPIWMRS
jgi:ABC-type transporter Mla maintaining outer membrane lipid asymmetry ATPase subunit MlaF